MPGLFCGFCMDEPCSCEEERIKWYLHIYVCGAYCGNDSFDSRELAELEKADRERKFSILGCHYIVNDVEFPFKS